MFGEKTEGRGSGWEQGKRQMTGRIVAASSASGLSTWRDGAAICRDGKHRGKTGFCGEIVSFMSLVLGVLSLKDL